MSSRDKKAIRIFTDRDEPRKVFKAAYKNFRDNGSKINVLSYYGVGGIGKTSLIRKIVSELEEREDKPLFACYSFEYGHEKRDVLENLRNMLVSKYKFDFMLFDEAVYNYDKKIGKQADYPYSASLLSSLPLMEEVLPDVEKFNVDEALKSLRLINAGYSAFKKIKRSKNKDVKEIRKSSVSELYEDFVFYFSEDIKRNVKNKNKPLIIFLDTYELLVNEMLSEGYQLYNDEWIRGRDGLIKNLPSVFWVIAGREKLKWEELDKEWTKHLDQHLLGELSETDASQFLEVAGFESAKLRHELYELTNGTPVYLDLCVDRLEELIKMGEAPEISLFGNDVHSLVARFVRDMSSMKKDMVYLLSCLGSWDDDAFFEIAKKLLISFSITDYESIKGFSFVTETETGYMIHKTIAAVLKEICSKDFRHKVLEVAMNYYMDKVRTSDIFEEKYSYYVRQWMYKCHEFCNNELVFGLYFFDFQEIFKKLLDGCRYESIYSIVEPMFENKKSRSIAYNVFDFYMQALVADEKYEKALEFVQKEYNKNTDKSVFIHNEEMGFNSVNGSYITPVRWYIHMLSLNDKDEEALALCEDYYSRLLEAEGKEDLLSIGAKLQLLKILNKMEKYDEVISRGKETYENEKAYLSSEIAGQLAYAMYLNGDYSGAVEIFKNLNDMETDAQTKVIALNGIGACLNELGEKETAREYLNQALALSIEVCGEDSEETACIRENIQKEA